MSIGVIAHAQHVPESVILPMLKKMARQIFNYFPIDYDTPTNHDIMSLIRSASAGLV